MLMGKIGDKLGGSRGLFTKKVTIAFVVGCLGLLGIPIGLYYTGLLEMSAFNAIDHSHKLQADLNRFALLMTNAGRGATLHFYTSDKTDPPTEWSSRNVRCPSYSPRG